MVTDFRHRFVFHRCQQTNNHL